MKLTQEELEEINTILDDDDKERIKDMLDIARLAYLVKQNKLIIINFLKDTKNVSSIDSDTYSIDYLYNSDSIEIMFDEDDDTISLEKEDYYYEAESIKEFLTALPKIHTAIDDKII